MAFRVDGLEIRTEMMHGVLDTSAQLSSREESGRLYWSRPICRREEGMGGLTRCDYCALDVLGLCGSLSKMIGGRDW
ncbi:hypothetical protein GOBAR_AA34951 [Gossypium barbadense]|uniref:Uncharacterized protein n=1 Tax=Gossypium barbadense TaxID=3634 RepID=A0A2P5W3Q7_GOSBA|nr:hypothetical protein GOBAR_AA34951 [Gossypium barbadense]